MRAEWIDNVLRESPERNAALALSPFMPANPPASGDSFIARQRNARSSGHTLSPKTPRPARRNAQHNPRGSRR